MIVWYSIDTLTQAALSNYQRRHFRRKLQLSQFEVGLVTAPLESTEEIERIMAMPAGDHRLRGDDAKIL